jgi:hypothetical protein
VKKARAAVEQAKKVSFCRQNARKKTQRNWTKYGGASKWDARGKSADKKKEREALALVKA